MAFHEQVRIAMTDANLYITRDKDRIGGPAKELFDKIFDALLLTNVTVVWSPTPSDIGDLKNGSEYTGLVGVLQRDEADLCPLAFSSNLRFSPVLYGPPVNTYYGLFFTSLKYETSDFDIVESLTATSNVLIGAILITLIVCALLLAISSGPFTVRRSCEFLVRLASELIYQHSLKVTNIKSRILAGCFAIVFIVITEHWLNNLSTDLVSIREMFINTIADIEANQTLDVKMFGGDPLIASIQDELLRSDLGPMRKFYNRIEVLEHKSPESQAQQQETSDLNVYFRNGKFVVVIYSLFFKFAEVFLCKCFSKNTEDEISKSSPMFRDRLWIGEEKFVTSLATPYYSKNISKSRKEHLDRRFRLIAESGIYVVFEEMFAHAGESFFVQESEVVESCVISDKNEFFNDVRKNMNIESIRLDNLKILFEILPIYLSFAIVVVLEIAYARKLRKVIRRRKSRDRRKRRREDNAKV